MYGDHFKSMAKHEAVRLGGEYQIAGKCTSFVAVESTKDSTNGTNGISVDNSAALEIGIIKAILPPGVSRLSASSMTPLSNSIELPAGFWELDSKSLDMVGISPAQHEEPEGLHLKLWATVIAVSIMEKKMSVEEEVWYVYPYSYYC